MQEKKLQIAKKVLHALREHYGKRTWGEFAAFLGIPEGTVGSWRSRGNLDEDLIIAKCNGISVSWLKTGEGEMFQDPMHWWKPEDHYKELGCQRVDIFNMVSGGPGAEPEWHEPIGQEVIPEKWLTPTVRPVLVRGRSMEPAIMDRAVIGVDTSDRHVVSGEIYAVMLPYEGAAVKRLFMLPQGVVIRSDNKEFPEVTINRDEVGDHFILGRVKWVLQEY